MHRRFGFVDAVGNEELSIASSSFARVRAGRISVAWIGLPGLRRIDLRGVRGTKPCPGPSEIEAALVIGQWQETTPCACWKCIIGR